MVTRRKVAGAKPKATTKKRKTAEQIAVEAEAQEKLEYRRYTVRIVALFLASGIAVVTTGAVIGVEVWKSVLMGGAAGLAQLVEKLARSAVRDGDISKDDLDEALDSLAE